MLNESDVKRLKAITHAVSRDVEERKVNCESLTVDTVLWLAVELRKAQNQLELLSSVEPPREHICEHSN